MDEARSRLRGWFDPCPGALVAFSGGVDSSLVAHLAHAFLGRDRMRAVISASPSLKMSELDGARRFARTHGIPLEVIVTAEMENPEYRANPANRCYFCKQSLYDDLDRKRAEHPGWWVLNGQNLDDAGDYRPGLQAAREFGVRAPLAECDIDKEGVRALAESFGLECWNKPASPCLASRVPYGEAITVAKLRQVEAAEGLLSAGGFPVVRVRHLGSTARVEVPPERIAEAERFVATVGERFAEIGFRQVEVDPEGFVSGKLNRVLGV